MCAGGGGGGGGERFLRDIRVKPIAVVVFTSTVITSLPSVAD